MFRVLLIVACLIVFINSLPNEFVIDDFLIIQQNPTIGNLSYLPKIFVTSYAVSPPTTYYRPLFSATLQVEYQIWKLRPWGYRLINILLHILVTLTIFQMGLRLLPNTFHAFLTGLIYAIHPVHVESVAWISGRADILACLGLLLGFYWYLKYRSDENHNILLFLCSLLFYFLSLLGKEMAVTLPLLIVFYDFTFPPSEKENYPFAKRCTAYAGYFLVLFNYLLIRKYAIGSALGTEFTHSDPIVRILTVLGVLVDYFRLLLFPTNMNADYITHLVTRYWDLHALLPLLVLIAIVYLLFKQRKSYPMIYFFGFWIFITLLPVSNLLPIRDEQRIEAERFLYIPSVGYCFMLSIILSGFLNFPERNVKSWKEYVMVILIGLLLSFYAVRTTIRNIDWRDSTTFYIRLTEDSPQSYKGWIELGNIEFRKSNSDGAILYYQNALACDSTRASIYVNLANAYALQNDYWKASEYLLQAHDMAPADPKIITNLAFIHYKLGNYDTALELLQKVIPFDPHNFLNYYQLGQVYEKKKMYTEAIQAYQTCVSVNSTYSIGWNNLGDLYTQLNKKDLAKSAYSHAK